MVWRGPGFCRTSVPTGFSTDNLRRAITPRYPLKVLQRRHVIITLPNIYTIRLAILLFLYKYIDLEQKWLGKQFWRLAASHSKLKAKFTSMYDKVKSRSILFPRINTKSCQCFQIFLRWFVTLNERLQCSQNALEISPGLTDRITLSRHLQTHLHSSSVHTGAWLMCLDLEHKLRKKYRIKQGQPWIGEITSRYE